jgi:hypothetical protein
LLPDPPMLLLREKSMSYFKPVDYLSFLYFSLISLLISLFPGRVDYWQWYLILHAGYLLMILAVAAAEARHPASRTLKFVRYLYPILAIAFVYSSIGRYVLVLHNHFFDPQIIALEKKLFGVYPNLWLERFVSRPVTEYFMFVYFCYYLYFTVPTLILFFQKRYAALEYFVFSVILAFYVSYFGFLLLPLRGPIFALADAFTIKTLSGYFFTPLQQFIMLGDPRGSCFPSSHVSVAWTSVAMIGTYFGRKYFWLIFPFAVSLTIAVFYNRYHYAVDALAGMIVAWACLRLSRWIYRKPG